MRAKTRPGIVCPEQRSARPGVGRGLRAWWTNRLAATLDGQDLVRLLALLTPLAVYDLVLSISRLFSDGYSGGFWRSLLEVVVAAQSSAIFGLGCAVFWFGLFALSSGRIFRWAAGVCLSLSAFFMFTIATAAAVYSQEFGTTLGYGVLRATISNPGDIAALMGVVPTYMLVIFVEVLVYTLAGIWLIAYVVERLGYVRSSGGRRLSPRGALAACVAGVVLCCLSLVPGLLGAKGSVYGDQAVEFAATAAREYRFSSPDWNTESPLASVALDETKETERRNVVLIHLESVRARSATPYNEEIETMPYLDTLADESLLAERAYTPVPYSSKALVSVNCGMYPHPASGIKESEAPSAVPANCLPELLEKEGYRTAWFQSSWKDFENWPQLVENFGYEEFYPVESMSTEGFEKANSWGYEDAIMLEPSRGWLENGDEPFIATYVTNAPHLEYLAPKRYGHRDFAEDDTFNRYLNSIRYVDFFVKNLIEQYKELGLYKNTIFVFYGDHGEAFGEHGLETHGPTPYDETLQVPLIIHDPQTFQDGERVGADTPVNHLDIAPTVLDMLGYGVANGDYPGSSLFRPIPEDRTLMFNCRPDVECAASLKGYEKYLYFYGSQPDEFYDLHKDPFEQNNLAEEMSDDELEKRRVEFLEWRLKTMAMYR